MRKPKPINIFTNWRHVMGCKIFRVAYVGRQSNNPRTGVWVHILRCYGKKLSGRWCHRCNSRTRLYYPGAEAMFNGKYIR